MNTCQNCKYGDRATDQDGSAFFFCRLAPPKPVVKPVVVPGPVEAQVAWVVPPMKPGGWCGQFKLAVFRWLANSVRRGT